MKWSEYSDVQNLCLDMDATHQMPLYRTEARWLSNGNVLNCLLDLPVEVEEFFLLQRKDWVALFKDAFWILTLSYLADIFEKLISSTFRYKEKKITSWI